MDSIIVGTDGSAGAQAAVNEAGRLARALGQKVVLVSAYTAATVNPGAAAMMPTTPFVSSDGRNDAEALLAEAADRLRANGVTCDTRAVCGSPAAWGCGPSATA